MRLLIVAAVLFVVGCGHRPPINPDVLDFPESLMTECEIGQNIDGGAPLSVNLNTMVQNNILWAECRIGKQALIEAIKTRQRAVKAP